MHCALFDVTTGNQTFGTKPGPRDANPPEVKAYMEFLRARMGLPDLGEPELAMAGIHARFFPGCESTCYGASFGAGIDRYGKSTYAEGAYSILMPGWDRDRQRVTMETLDEAGNVARSATLPREPKKGGVLWTKEQVRASAGPIAKPAKVRRSKAKASPEPQEAAAEPVPALEPVDLADALSDAPAAIPDPIADIFSRLEALEARVAALPAENEAVPIAAAQPAARRTPAHERAIRRAWAERRARREEAAGRELQVEIGVRQLAEIKDERDEALQLLNTELLRAKGLWDDLKAAGRKRGATLSRARATLSRSRQALAGKVQRIAVLEAELAKIRHDMADPSQPERASDIARLVKERDEARTACTALERRCQRSEAAVAQLADKFEAMAIRVAKAEAATRRAA